MLGTSTTPYDLRFTLLGIPVRVHPLFWLIMAALGWQEHNLPAVVVWVGCAFASILVHEFGHGLMAKRFRGSPSIVLYGLGGLCYSQAERTPGERLAVILAGPGAGFILCFLTLIVTSGLFGVTGSEHLAIAQRIVRLGGNPEDVFGGLGKLPPDAATWIYLDLFEINLLWGLINLLPIWPLDGGQATQVVLSMADRKHGTRRGHILSLVTAGFLAVAAASQREDFMLVIFFGMFAFLNFQILQSLQQAQSFGVYHEDDWWRR
jgi:stage IV sporulation protein FB